MNQEIHIKGLNTYYEPDIMWEINNNIPRRYTQSSNLKEVMLLVLESR